MGAKTNLYLRGKTWWCWFYDHQGKRVRRSTHQKDRALAKKVARRIEVEHLTNGDRPLVLTLEEVLAMMLAAAERKGRAEDTLEFYMKKSRQLIRVLGGDRDVATLTLRDSEAYWDVREEEGAGRHTIKKELGTLRTALNHAKKHKRYEGDPKALIPDGLENAYKPCTRVLTHAEYRQLGPTSGAIFIAHAIAPTSPM